MKMTRKMTMKKASYLFNVLLQSRISAWFVPRGASRRLLMLALLVLLVSGCAAGIERAYQGGALPRHEVARLKIQAPAQLRAINEDTSFNKRILSNTPMDVRTIEVTPGTYRLTFYFNNEDASTWPFGATNWSEEDIHLTVSLGAGRLYKVRYKLLKGGRNVVMWIEQVTDFDTIDRAAYRSFRQGRNEYKAGNYSEALALFGMAVARDPSFAEAYRWSGLAHIELGERNEAIKEISKTVRLQPDSPYGYSNLGWLFYELEKWAEAVKYYNAALSIRPDVQDYFNRGYCNNRLRRFQEAVDDFTQYILHEGPAREAYFNRAIAYENLGDFKSAKKDRETYNRLERQRK